MRSARFLLSLVMLASVGPPWANAAKIYRIGALVAEDQFVAAFEGFKKRMAELGYIEGKNINYDFHNAKGDVDTLKEQAQKIVREKPDLIVTSSTTATAPVAKLTEGTDLPVVFLSAGNPLRFVKSYSSSGNNVTGITTSAIDLIEKRMELLRELVPKIQRVVAVLNPKGENYEAELKATQGAAKRLGLGLLEVPVASQDELIKTVKERVNRNLGEGVFLPADAIVHTVKAVKEITPHLSKEKLPSIAVNSSTVRAGALAAYGADYFALGQQGAVLVDKILKGSRPTDLPIELPFKFYLVINLKTAKAIGLKIPKEILLRADEVIE